MNQRPAIAPLSALFALFAAIFLAGAASRGSAQGEEGFAPLFNGADLAGWAVAEGEPLVVEEAALVGNPKGPGTIRTEAAYADFILRLEFYADAGSTHEANGGVFFRGGEGDPPARGFECQISMQDPKNPTGSIYGRVAQNLELVRSIAPEKQWNALEIKCVGPRIQISLNGEPVQDCILHDFKKGYIGLQHHHNGCIIKYRNIRLKPLAEADAEPGWESIFNGGDLGGWAPKGAAQWKPEAGEIAATGGPGYLYYAGRDFANFELFAMVKADPGSNGGLLFRSRWPEAAPDGLAVGYECQISNLIAADGSPTANHATGSVFGLAAAPLLTRDETWMSLRVRAVGEDIQTFVNGRKVTELKNPAFTAGWIALQSFTPASSLHFRDLLIREIK